MAIKLADTLAPMADFPAAMAEHIEFDDGENLQEKYDLGELGGEGGAGHIELTQVEYDALTDEEKMNGSVYFITDAEGGENNVEDFYYKDLPTENLVFTQGTVAIRDTDGVISEFVDETVTNRIKTDEYINCNDLYYEINVPSEYTLMTRAYTKDDDGNMIALTNIPEFNGVFTIKDIIYSRVSVPSAPATQEEILGCYRQNNLYFRFCLKD
jgi:hypothetical protein